MSAGRWWVSWYGAGAFEYHGPWWISGGSDGEGRATICAAVIAHDGSAARGVIEASHHDAPLPSIDWRFADARGRDWSPFTDRFPRADWMRWPTDGDA